MSQEQEKTQDQANVQSSQNTKQDASLKYKVLRSLDLFQFMPVPKTAPVSSKRSLYGTFCMIFLFVAYFIFTFVSFVTNNTPMVNQYYNILPEQNITVPTIAFAFFFGDPFEQTINDPTIFTFAYQQVVKFADPAEDDIKTTIDLVQCNPSWLPEQNFSLLCPQIPGEMSGALYQTDIFTYPRIQINYCKNSGNLTCVSTEQLFKYTSGGRILLYIRDNGPDFDMTTGKPIESIPYQVFQYFLMPGFYPRCEIYFQKQIYTIYPDYFRRFTSQIKDYLVIENDNVWLTNVSIYNPYNAFQIYFRMDQNQMQSFLKYLTFMDLISLWGAFWGVLFGAFAAYFLHYNRTNFYEENQDWDNFGNKIGVKKAKDCVDWDDDAINPNANTLVFEMKQLDPNPQKSDSEIDHNNIDKTEQSIQEENGKL